MPSKDSPTPVAHYGDVSRWNGVQDGVLPNGHSITLTEVKVEQNGTLGRKPAMEEAVVSEKGDRLNQNTKDATSAGIEYHPPTPTSFNSLEPPDVERLSVRSEEAPVDDNQDTIDSGSLSRHPHDTRPNGTSPSPLLPPLSFDYGLHRSFTTSAVPKTLKANAVDPSTADPDQDGALRSSSPPMAASMCSSDTHTPPLVSSPHPSIPTTPAVHSTPEAIASSTTPFRRTQPVRRATTGMDYSSEMRQLSNAMAAAVEHEERMMAEGNEYMLVQQGPSGRCSSSTGIRKSLRRSKGRDQSDDDDKVLIGTRIAEGHENYVLMYNMLTGIRIAVGRVSAKLRQNLTPEDFTAAHKLVFDMYGNELTPGSRYDFKFKDYAPWVFRHLREQFHIDPADYLVSLTSKYILSELGSPGKSGSFFYYSRDYRFIIKTIHHTEHKFMRRILKQYYEHICANPNTLLCRFYGLHRVKLPHGRKIHFMVMGNVFPPNKDVHETYDLKGSTFGRYLPEEEVARNPNAVMKDLNWERKNRKLELGPTKRHLFVKQLQSDVKLLQQLNIMDYSLLIGLHDLKRGNKDNIRDTTLSLFQIARIVTAFKKAAAPVNRAERRKSLAYKRASSGSTSDRPTSSHAAGNNADGEGEKMMKMAVAQVDELALDVAKLTADDSIDERRNCAFYADDGGFTATTELNAPSNVQYFMGIIDILTPYNVTKKLEHFWKGMTQDKATVPPQEYGERFYNYMLHIIQHNEDVVAPGGDAWTKAYGGASKLEHQFTEAQAKARAKAKGKQKLD
ncbi:hypothetical protein BZG36_02687 [Bifiguratus adelaidae]|uniref:1-phosphatidylinositol-4-phosphate 5-kinase n=1 Tax=Bifiguratus adelaidae TaxID=1938954 RepID=A0A261Y1J8_9FUNG|nr:hypothetical protein BZG36_02687 [Bifiguratus adelaidae]